MKLMQISLALLVGVSLAVAQTNSASTDRAEAKVGFDGMWGSTSFGERTASFNLDPEVKVQINAPPQAAFAHRKKVMLIFYTLPNGNTIEQTIGRKLKPGDDWHFDIQHIGAQTRFLRDCLTDRALVVVYLQAASKSWPAWRKKFGDDKIPMLIAEIRKIFADNPTEIVLASHSGGGSFVFGYLNAMEKIPDDVTRIAFLDSNYGYDAARGHTEKLIRWLKQSRQHYLCVLAYNDAVALLDGKTFVSAEGGTWGRSHTMLKDFGKTWKFSTKAAGEGLEQVSTLNGRVQFLLKENPEKKIFHTVQVERNGFIHAMVSGTRKEGKGYQYFGERAYSRWIDDQ